MTNYYSKPPTDEVFAVFESHSADSVCHEHEMAWIHAVRNTQRFEVGVDPISYDPVKKRSR